MKKFFMRYRVFFLLLALNLVLALTLPDLGLSAFTITKGNLTEMLKVMPPIFILLGLLDVWVEKETMMRYVGQGSGGKGLLIAITMGTAAAGPLYAAFPVATVMLRKGASLRNVFVFIGVWSTAKIPMLSFEIANLGFDFTTTRLVLSLIGIIIIAWVVEHSLTPEQQQEVYDIAQNN